MARKLPRPKSHWELVVNPQEAGGQTKHHKFWQTPSIDYARMGCHQSGCGPEFNWEHARVDCWGLEKEESTLQIDSLHQLHVIVKSLWHLWNACNYTSVFHSNIWQKYLKTLKQQTLWKLIFVILKTFGHDCTVWKGTDLMWHFFKLSEVISCRYRHNASTVICL